MLGGLFLAGAVSKSCGEKGEMLPCGRNGEDGCRGAIHH